MKLMIVESPNKIKKIKAILGSGWDVAASVGHIRDLPVKSLGIEPNTYRLEYQILERSELSLPWAAKLDPKKLPTGSKRPWVSRSTNGLMVLKP